MKLHPSGRPIVGVEDRRQAFNLALLDLLPPDQRLSKLLVPAPRRGRHDHKGFESKPETKTRKSQNIASLNGYARICDQIPERQHLAAPIRALTAALKRSGSPRVLSNLANPEFMRSVRNAFISHLMATVANVDPGTPVHIVHIIIKEGFRTPAELLRTDCDDIFGMLRAHLYRKGLAELEGWFVLGIHGEFRKFKDRFELHIHGVVVGEKWRAFAALRELPMFKGGKGAAVTTPIRLDVLENPARQISYILQPFWPTKHPGEAAGVDDNFRGKPRRIPEPFHAQYLLWLSRQRFSDLVWMHGVAIRNSRLEPTSEL